MPPIITTKLRSICSDRNTLVPMIIIFLAGLVPLLWLRPGFIVAMSDSYPMFLNPQKTLSTATSMWSPDTMGTPALMPAFIIYMYVETFFGFLGFSVGATQIIYQILFFMGAGFSMFYLSKVLYPKLTIAPLLAGLFYMFNFYVLQSRLNVGWVWTYAFLPLLMALLIKAVETTYQEDKKKTNLIIILFSVISMVALSFATITPTNNVLILSSLFLVAIYEIFKHRKELRPLLFTIGKIILISIPLNVWWIYPLLNVYVLPPQALNSQINVFTWDWTQVRSSFLNLFWLNGTWSWRPEYIPYFNSYSNPTNSVLMVLVFVPFLVAASALLFRSTKSRLNACLMLAVLFFVFLAKGLHPPLEGVNALLYEHVPFMNMFREPTTKFTMLIVVFLSPLIGYGGAHLANLEIGKIGKINSGRCKRLFKFLVPAFLIAIFIVAAFPIVDPALNPLETKTTELPSSYIKIPNYWYQATSWINSQSGDYSVLFTPLDDFYQMPYDWGYYGVDQLFYRLIDKPIISTDYLFSYVLKPDTVAALEQMQTIVYYNNTSGFKDLLDLLNIKYILQRNDVNSTITGRNILSPDRMGHFFAAQPYLRLVKSFEQLDLYEYIEAKPSFYAFSNSIYSKSNIAIQTYNATEEPWNFSSPTDIQAWAEATKTAYNESNVIPVITSDNGSLKATYFTLPMPPGGWEIINSSKISVSYGVTYEIQAQVKAEGFHYTDLVISEYQSDGTNTNYTVASTDQGEAPINNLNVTYKPSSIHSAFVQIAIYCSGNYTYVPLNETWLKELPKDWPSNSTLVNEVANEVNEFKSNNEKSFWLNYLNVTSETPVLIAGGINELFNADGKPEILKCQIINPQKAVLTVNATEPFVIATSQVLNKDWVAIVNGKQVKPSSLYLGLEGFNITGTGTGTINVTIEYQPQNWFNYSAALAIVTLALCSVYLIYQFSVKRRFPEKNQY